MNAHNFHSPCGLADSGSRRLYGERCLAIGQDRFFVAGVLRFEEFLVGHWLSVGCQSCQSAEGKSLVPRASAVEPEGEFVQVRA
ncbi:MAG: hypothetical protein ACYDHP_07940 [Ferrimicrobium sp.]